MNILHAGRGFLVGALDAFVKFLAMDLYAQRRIESETNLGSINRDHRHLNIVTEDDRFPLFARDDQHSATYSLKNGGDQPETDGAHSIACAART